MAHVRNAQNCNNYPYGKYDCWLVVQTLKITDVTETCKTADNALTMFGNFNNDDFENERWIWKATKQQEW